MSQGKKTLRIGLLAHGGTQWMGGELYVRNLLTALIRFRSKQSPQVSYQIIVFHADPQALVARHPVFAESDVLVSCPSMNAGLLGKFKLFIALLRSGINVAYPCHVLLPPWPGIRRFAWIVDFQYDYYPSLFSPQDLRHRQLAASLAARFIPEIILSSEHAKRDFQRLFPHSKACCHVLHFHSLPDEDLWRREPNDVVISYSLPNRFMICSGQFWAHKNHLLLLESLATAVQEVGDLFIVFTGHLYDYRNPSYLDKVLTTINRLGLRSNTALLGLIPRQEQLQLIRASVAVIQPSLFEGWSTVVEDARTLGKPIILSNIDVHIEQSVDRSFYFDPKSKEELTRQMLRLWYAHDPGPSNQHEAEAHLRSALNCDQMATSFLSIIGSKHQA
jgi:glycosyltransferase involved in cell wall biosynthesis